MVAVTVWSEYLEAQQHGDLAAIYPTAFTQRLPD